MDAEITSFFRRGYSTIEIAAALGLDHDCWWSVRTVQRRLRSLDLQVKGEESPINDIIHAVQEELRGSGRRLGVQQIWKRLIRCYHLKVQQQTVRDLVEVIEPGRQEAMRKGRLQRRVYTVNGPNLIWHVDGNDEIKPYGLSINGAIDGWSRKLIWLNADHTNSDPELIGKYFLNAVREHGVVPRIVRMDRGTENGAVSDLQHLLRENHNDDLAALPVLYGSSNHNQRIERYWGYMRNSLGQSYIDLFKDLCAIGILDTSNMLHIDCVRFCYLPLLRQELRVQFTDWNTHRVRKIKHTACPTAVPDFMYHHPQFYNATDQGLVPDAAEVQECLELNEFQKNEYGSSDEFAEWALTTMVANGWEYPRSFEEASETFSNLITEIHAA